MGLQSLECQMYKFKVHVSRTGNLDDKLKWGNNLNKCYC